MNRVIDTRDGAINLVLDETNNVLKMQSDTEEEVFTLLNEDIQDLKASFPGLGPGRLLLKIGRAISKAIGGGSSAK